MDGRSWMAAMSSAFCVIEDLETLTSLLCQAGSGLSGEFRQDLQKVRFATQEGVDHFRVEVFCHDLSTGASSTPQGLTMSL